jgi:hypothetical protein
MSEQRDLVPQQALHAFVDEDVEAGANCVLRISRACQEVPPPRIVVCVEGVAQVPRARGTIAKVAVELVTLAVEPRGRRSSTQVVVPSSGAGAAATESTSTRVESTSVKSTSVESTSVESTSVESTSVQSTIASAQLRSPTSPPPVKFVKLDHAGPAAAAWSKERSVGVDEVEDFATRRRSRALAESEWRAVVDAYARSAAWCAKSKLGCALGVDDDGLLHRSWSTLGRGGSARIDRVLEVHRACGPVDVVLCVEDLAPGGCDATDGIELARALVKQGARRIFANAGSGALPALRRREKGTAALDDDDARACVHLLASAAWLVGRVPADVEIVALVPRGDANTLSDVAHALGLAGVVVEESMA